MRHERNDRVADTSNGEPMGYGCAECGRSMLPHFSKLCRECRNKHEPGYKSPKEMPRVPLKKPPVPTPEELRPSGAREANP